MSTLNFHYFFYDKKVGDCNKNATHMTKQTSLFTYKERKL